MLRRYSQSFLVSAASAILCIACSGEAAHDIPRVAPADEGYTRIDVLGALLNERPHDLRGKMFKVIVCFGETVPAGPCAITVVVDADRYEAYRAAVTEMYATMTRTRSSPDRSVLRTFNPIYAKAYDGWGSGATTFVVVGHFFDSRLSQCFPDASDSVFVIDSATPHPNVPARPAPAPN